MKGIAIKLKEMEFQDKITTTNYTKFLEGKKIEEYHCVMMLMLEDDLTADDLVHQ